MKIYVTGPYTADTPDGVRANVERAMSVTIMCIRKGHTVFCPHLSHYLHLHALGAGIEIPYTEWLRQDLALLPHCDALVATQGEDAMLASKGSVIEREAALIHGLILYAGPEDVPTEHGI